MSSEGSVSSNGSRIRQFGLYRGIDARTEEFLRLSRRRQIRQGCACAAVSTVITVTVVVVVIFVYEFSLNSEVNIEGSLRTNWLNLINDTTENVFKTKYTKSDIDKTTLTLLPILLKALKKNVFLEKILEEQSSSSPVYQVRETTEYSMEKNVFTRNINRMPSSKFYTIAFKPSPKDYYKSSSKNLEYFTKIRKIRDYQRIINYVDKMINEKVYIGATKPMMKGETFSEKPLPKIMHIPKKKHVTELVSKDVNIKKEGANTNCKCPMKLGKILNSILSGIEKLLSVVTNTDTKINNCHNVETVTHKNKAFDLKPVYSERNEYHKTSTVKSNSGNKEKSQQKDNKLRDNIKTSQELSWSNIHHHNDLKRLESSTLLLNDQLDATDDSMKIYTKPMTRVNLKKNVLNPTSILNVLGKNTQFLDENTPDIISINKNNMFKHLSSTVAFNDLLNYNRRETHKNKENRLMEKFQENTLNKKKVVTYKPTSYKKPELVGANTSTKINWLKNLNKAMYQIIENNKNLQTKYMTTETTKSIPNIKLTKKFSSINLSNDTLRNTEIKKNVLSNIVDEEVESLSNLTQEDLFKQIESSIIDPPIVTNNSVTNSTEELWEELKNENIPVWKSMMPNIRPVYLEIQHKNDWRHENEDYDFNTLNTYDNILE